MMNRRKALGNIAYGLGYVVATPTFLTVLNSCKGNNEENWTPEFLNSVQKHMVTHLTNIILPISSHGDDSKLNLAKFVDKMMAHTVKTEDQSIFNKGSDVFAKKFVSAFKKEPLEGTKTKYDRLLKIYFDVSKENQTLVIETLKMNISEIPKDEKETFLVYKFLVTVRYFSLLGYYTSTSEEIIENKLTKIV